MALLAFGLVEASGLLRHPKGLVWWLKRCQGRHRGGQEKGLRTSQGDLTLDLWYCDIPTLHSHDALNDNLPCRILNTVWFPAIGTYFIRVMIPIFLSCRHGSALSASGFSVFDVIPVLFIEQGRKCWAKVQQAWWLKPARGWCSRTVNPEDLFYCYVVSAPSGASHPCSEGLWLT